MIITENNNNNRLDKILEDHPQCINLGLRARKRMCDESRVAVNGIIRPAHFKVRTGQEITIIESYIENNEIKLEILKEDENFVAFYKDKNIPTVSYQGSITSSLELEIMKQFPNIVLLNRLDTQTSGIVVAAKSDYAYDLWKNEQELGLIEKKYIAYVEGELQEDCVIDYFIQTKKNKVKAIKEKIAENIRCTHVEKLYFDGENSYVDCTIFKGTRHQIRCHLASIGHELIGDTVYNENEQEENAENFFLHHYKIESEIFTAECIGKKDEEKYLFRNTGNSASSE